MSDDFSLEFSIRDFNSALDDYEKKITKEKAKDALIGIAIQALSEFIRLTPVDTGRAKGGWFVAASTLGISTGGNAKNNNAGAIIMDLDGENKSITIINRVKYVKYLEYGHSGQAPQGMVRRTLARMKRQLGAK